MQVLQESYVQATRVTRPNRLTHIEATDFVTAMQRFRVQDVTLDVFRSALAIAERFQISYWDSAILAAAGQAGCATVYSEDLEEGLDYHGVQVVNPFRE